jgi:steroid 5-alpha reductase family enzyme
MSTTLRPDSTSSAHSPASIDRTRAFRVVALAYGMGGFVAVLTGLLVAWGHPIAIVFWADVAATCAVFAFSIAFANSSFYDAYWSVAPIAIAAFFAFAPLGTEGDGDAATARVLVVFALVCAWGGRLTWNWARGWTGLDHEDWRYIMLRERTGLLYWLVNFAGIHMIPTLVVFAGCLSLYPALATGTRPFRLFDFLATIVTAGAIALEGVADNQLRRFRLGNPPPGALLETGLWAHSRHPNYLGEILFWWGLWLFGVAAAPGAWWWTLVGPVSISVLFYAASLPMIENRMLARRPDYARRIATTPLLIPRFQGSGRP